DNCGSAVVIGEIVERNRDKCPERALMWFRSVYFKIGFRTEHFFYTNRQYIDGIVVVGNGECHTSVAVTAPLDSGSGIAAALQVTSGNLPINTHKTVGGKAVVYCAVLTNAKTNACFNLFDQII